MVADAGHHRDRPDGFRNAPNTDTPFVDQSQTYTSHSSHQVFLREYVNNTAGRPVATGKFLSRPTAGWPPGRDQGPGGDACSASSWSTPT